MSKSGCWGYSEDTKRSSKFLWHEFLKMSDFCDCDFCSLKMDTHMFISNSETDFPLISFSFSSQNHHSPIYPSYKPGVSFEAGLSVISCVPSIINSSKVLRNFSKQFFLLYPYSNLWSRSFMQYTTVMNWWASQLLVSDPFSPPFTQGAWWFWINWKSDTAVPLLSYLHVRSHTSWQIT